MVEKKTEKKVEKKTTKKPVRKTSNKKPTTHSRKPVEKTVVKTVPVKVEKNTCHTAEGKSCAIATNGLTIAIGVLLLINIILSILLLCDKMSYNNDKIAELGGVENYNLLREVTNMDNFKKYTNKIINKTIEDLNK